MNTQGILPNTDSVPAYHPSVCRSSTLADIKWILISLFALLAGGSLIVCGLFLRLPSMPPSVVSAGLSIDSLRQVARLVVLEVPTSDVVTSERTGPLHLGAQRCRLTIHGVAEVGSDLQLGKFIDVNDADRTATLVLPTPTVISARLDHARSRVFDIDRQGLWRAIPGEIGTGRLLDASFAKAEEMLRQAAAAPEHIAAAKNQAEAVLVPFFHKLGWNVAIQWS